MSVLSDAITAMETSIAGYGAGVQTELDSKADTTSLGTIASHNFSSGTADPTGGVDGDIYAKLPS